MLGASTDLRGAEEPCARATVRTPMKLLDWAWIAVTMSICGCSQPSLTPRTSAPHRLEDRPTVPVAPKLAESEPVKDLHGSIVVKLENADNYVPKSGTMQVYLSPWTGDPNFVTVTIENGSWSCTSPYDGRGLAFGKLLLFGRDAYTYVDEFIEPGQREIAVEAHWLESTRVHVEDEHTHRRVTGARVRLFSYPGKRTSDPRECSPHEELAKGDGEFLLDAWSMWMFPGANKDGYDVWVEAPGYLPRIQFLNPWQGGDWIVELSADP